MNPDGMVALLNYREDGVTRKQSSLLGTLWLILSARSLFHVLEGWPEGGQVVNVYYALCMLYICCHLLVLHKRHSPSNPSVAPGIG